MVVACFESAVANRSDHRLGRSTSGTTILRGLPNRSLFVLIRYGRQERARNHQALESLAASGKGRPPDSDCTAPNRKGVG
jgi:hypothetical protein